MDVFQGRPDGDEYHQNEHKGNASCVFFSRNLAIKIPERRQYFTRCSSFSIVNFEHVIIG